MMIRSKCYIDSELLGKLISTNHKIKELLINLPQHCFSTSNTLINSILTGVKRNDTIQFFSLSCDLSDETTILSLEIEELLKINQTLQAVKLNIRTERILPSLCIIPANECLTALNISIMYIHYIITYPVKKTGALPPELENVGRNITHLKSLSLQVPLIPLSVLFDSNPFLQHLDIVLVREENFVELFNILSSNTTIINLRIRNVPSLYRQVLHQEVGKSFQLMLSSNQTLHYLEVQDHVLPVKYLTAGFRENNTLQELAIDTTLSENVKEFFETINNLKSLSVKLYAVPFGSISDQELMSWYHEEIILHVTNMLKRNKDIKFMKLSLYFTVDSRVRVQDDWIPIIHQFWEAVLLHPSLCYIYVHRLMRDVLNDMKKVLFTQREEKKLGPPPLVEIVQ